MTQLRREPSIGLPDCGDDYLVEPFALAELLVRVHALDADLARTARPT